VTSVGTPKAGVFSEGQAKVVADEIIARHHGGDADTYGGRGGCYIEFGDGRGGQGDGTFFPGQTPVGVLDGRLGLRAHDKGALGPKRIRRWFGREWSNF